MNQGFELQPNAAGQTVRAKIRGLPMRGKLLAIAPHMHFRGNQFTATMVSKDAQRGLLRVPGYDFNWQHNYELAEPLDLRSLEGIETEFVFDNSTANPFNPDPTSHVTWGDQTWEEMAIAFFDVSRPRDTSSDNQDAASGNQAADAQIEKKVQRQTDKFLERFDADDDGLIQRDDLPLAIRVREFGRCDANSDGRIDRQELMDRFRQRLH
jgi:hypothetical protein